MESSMLRRFTDFILKSRWQAMGAALLFSLLPLIGGSISIIIVGLVTLRKGAYEGTLVFCASILPFLLNYIAYPVSTETFVLFLATVIVIIINMLTWLFALILRRFNNWSVVIEISALLGIVAVVTTHLVYPDLANWWEGQLTAYFNRTASVIGQLAPEGDPAAHIEVPAQAIASLKQYATGFVVASLVMNALLQLLIARWWQAAIFNPGGLKNELRQIRLGYVSAIVFVAVVALTFLNCSICVDLLPVVILAFCAAGLSLVHELLATSKTAWLWLTLVYLGVIFVFPVGAIIVALLGLLDTAIDFRKRLQKD